jgi:hypothetical protein
MFLWAARLLTDRANDVTDGVNAKLAAVTTTHGDAAAPALALVADSTRNIHAALGRLPDAATSYPCLLVCQPEQGNTWDPHAMVAAKRDASIQVLVRYAQMESDAVKGTRNLHYTMEALARVIEGWFGANESARTLNSFYVMYCESMIVQEAWIQEGDKVVTGAMLLTFRMRNTTTV